MDMCWTHLEFKFRPSHQNPFSTPTESPQHCLGSEEVPTQGGPGAHLNTGVVATDCLLLTNTRPPSQLPSPPQQLCFGLVGMWACVCLGGFSLEKELTVNKLRGVASKWGELENS